MKHVFISYKREERDYVAALASVLETNGYLVWWDHDIPGGARWERKIKEALDQAFVEIIIVTPEGEESEWMEKEQLYAAEKKLPLIPLLRKGDLWFRVFNLQRIDGRDNTADNPVPNGLFAALLQYAPCELPDELKKKVNDTDQARLRLIPDLVELAERVNSPQGMAAREVLQQWAALPPDKLSRMARAALEGLPPPGTDEVARNPFPQQPAEEPRYPFPQQPVEAPRSPFPKQPVPAPEALPSASAQLRKPPIPAPEALPQRPIQVKSSPRNLRVTCVVRLAAAMLLIGVLAVIIDKSNVLKPPAPAGTELLGSVQEWNTYREDPPRSSIDLRQNNEVIEISYNVAERGYVGISKPLLQPILVGTGGIRFTYQGMGNPNTIEMKLIYRQGTVFSVAFRHATVTNEWRSIEIPYDQFRCWAGTGQMEDKCPPDQSLRLNLEKVSIIDFAFSNKLRDPNNPNDFSPEDVPGPGTILLRGVAAMK